MSKSTRTASLLSYLGLVVASLTAQRVTRLSTARAEADSPIAAHYQVAWRRYTPTDGNWLELWDYASGLRSLNPVATADARLVGFVAPSKVLVRFGASLYVYSFITGTGTLIETSLGGDNVHADGYRAVWSRRTSSSDTEIMLYDGRTATVRQLTTPDGVLDFDPYVEGNWVTWVHAPTLSFNSIMRYDIAASTTRFMNTGAMVNSPLVPMTDEAGRVLSRHRDLAGGVGTMLDPGSAFVSWNDGHSGFNRAYGMHLGQIAHFNMPTANEAEVWLEEEGFARRTIARWNLVPNGLGDHLVARDGMTAWFASAAASLRVHDGKELLSFPTNTSPSGAYPVRAIDGGRIVYNDRTSSPPGLVTLYESKMTWGPDQLSASSGYAIPFTLWAGPAYANHIYLVLASASGTYPGTPLGSQTVPLNIDPLTLLGLQSANLDPTFGGFVGLLDGSLGAGSAQFQPRAGLLRPLVGQYLTFVYLVIHPVTGAIEVVSNPARLKIVP